MNDVNLAQATRLADIADEITTKYYLSSTLQVTDKPDDTPVTQADLEVETVLSKIVHEEFKDSYIGEEGVRDAATGRYWVVDPIDGTKNFMRGMPIWGTLIGLFDEKGPLVAFVSAPALGRRWWAVRGQGSFTQDVNGTERDLHVSSVSNIANASLMHSSIYSWDKSAAGTDAMLGLLRKAWRDRSVGDFFGHMLVAEGAVDACFEPNPKLWDIAPLELIITEAGGKVWTSATADTKPEEPRIVITSNGKLEAPIVDALGK
jgi:histidinol-phosphatase